MRKGRPGHSNDRAVLARDASPLRRPKCGLPELFKFKRPEFKFNSQLMMKHALIGKRAGHTTSPFSVSLSLSLGCTVSKQMFLFLCFVDKIL